MMASRKHGASPSDVDVADSSPSGCSRGQAAESNGWLADFVDMPASPFALFNVSSADLGEPPCSF